MNIDKTFQILCEADETEKKALEFKNRTGRIPEGVDLLSIIDINLNKFSDQVGIDLNDFHSIEEVLRIIDIPDSILLHEDFCFQNETNIELNKADRFQKMFPHRHDFFEIECVLKGTCIHTVEKQNFSLKNGDIVIVPPNVVHTAAASDDGVTVNIKIRQSTFDRVFINILSIETALSTYLSNALYSKRFRTSMTFHCGDDDFVRDLILYMYTQQVEMKPFFSGVLEGMAVTLFSYLIQNHSDDIEISNRLITRDDRISKIIEYINKNYRTATLKSTAKKFFINQQYLSSLIKSKTGLTFSDILREIKMKNAGNLLLTTDMKIADICDFVGYKDTTQFIRSFKAFFGQTPGQYRKKSLLK